jgi:cytochrome c553
LVKGFKMKKVLITALFASISLIAADSTPVKKSAGFAPINGATIYNKSCAICHGEDGRKIPSNEASVLAGRDAVRLALRIRAYRDQDTTVGTYTMNKASQIMKDQTSKLSDREVSAVAKYISGLE